MLHSAAIGGVLAGVLATAGCAAPPANGAPAPPKGVTLADDSAVASAAAPAVPGRDDSASGGAAVVTAYFARINAASTSGQLANVSDLALPGCQACGTDIDATRWFVAHGVHADVGSLVVTAVTPQKRLANSLPVRFVLTVRQQRLIDPTGKVVTTYQAQQPRAGTAVLALTRNGWRIQTFVYAPRSQ